MYKQFNERYRRKRGTTKIYVVGYSILMGIDVLGTVLEMKSDDPITIGGRALHKYRRYLASFVPKDFAPLIHPDLRLKRYFQAEELELSSLNVYAGWIATFFSWPLLPIVQSINLFQWLKRKLLAASATGEIQNNHAHDGDVGYGIGRPFHKSH